MVQMIPDDIDLSAYMDTPDFRAKVRQASDFADQVKAGLRPADKKNRSPRILIPNASETIEFRPAEVTAWVGYNGHRKSMFTSQVALDMAVQGERVLIVSLEMAPATTMQRMVRQATGMAYPPDDLVDRFHEWTNGKVWVFDHLGNITVDHAFALCRYFREQLGGTHVFLDSMMMICESEERLDEQKRFSTGALRLALETQLHVHVVTHCKKPQNGDDSKVPGRYDIRGSGAISDQAHNTIAVWMNKAKYATLEQNPNDMEANAEPCAVVKCDKQRNGKWEGKFKLWNDGRSLRFCEDRTSEVLPYDFLMTKQLGEAEGFEEEPYA
jgi:twinkle protein